jgi:hypothetical protein
VVLGVELSRFFQVVGRVEVVAMGYMSMVARLFVIASLMVFRSFSMMVRRFLVVLGSLAMVLCAFV